MEPEGGAMDVEKGTMPGRRERLLITKMVLENFKSYAGEREIGPFHKKFSSIVGPNGSGKSNVIDALLFVFGKRAKKLRLNKVSELIHNSENHKNLDFARVSVHFCEIVDHEEDEDNYEVVSGSEFVVSRVAFKNNQSKYLLNGKNSSFTEVTELLKEKGIDLDNNRFLILQGEVEQIAMMKPIAQNPHEEGLLEYLEDIIGSNRYVPDIETAGNELQQLDEQRVERLNRVKVVEKEKDGLEGAKLEAEQVLCTDLELTRTMNVLFQIYVHEAQQVIEKVQEKHDKLSEKKSYEEEKLGKHLKELEEKEKAYNEAVKSLELVTETMNKAKTEFVAFERKDIKYREDIKHTKAQIEKIKATIKKEEQKAGSAKKKKAELEKSIPSLEEAVEDNKARIQAEEKVLDKIMDTLKDKTESLRAQLEQLQVQAKPYHQAVNDLESKVLTTTTEIELVEAPTTAAKRELSEAEAALQQAIENDKMQEAQLKKLKNDLEKSRTRAIEVADLLDRTVSEEQALEKEAQGLSSKLEETKAAHQSSSQRGDMLRALLLAKKKNGPLERAGLAGRLGDLGAIDSKYDVAISTGCAALDYLVVETTHGAQMCVKYLRDNNLGRATFIILEQLRYLEPHMNKSISIPPGVSRLFDLIQVRDQKYRIAFYFALRNTLVAKDLDQAVSIAYQGNKCLWRVVSLDGQLIETSGAMSGGGNRTRRGGMAAQLTTTSPEELNNMQRDMDQLMKALDSLRIRKRELDSEARHLKGEASSLELKIQKLELGLAAGRSARTDLEATISALMSKTHLPETDQKKLEGLRANLKSYEADLKAQKKILEGLQAKIESVQQQILDVGGPKLKAQKDKLAELSSAHDAAITAVSKAKMEVKSCDKNMNKAEKAIESASQESESLEDQLQKMRLEFKAIEDDAFKVMESYKIAEQVVKEEANKVSDIKTEFDALKKIVNKIRTVEVDIQNQLEDYERTMKENKSKQEHWLRKKQAILEEFKDQVAEVRELLGDNVEHVDDKGDVLEGKFGSLETPPALSEDELSRADKEEVKYKITMLEHERDKLKANVNMGAIAEFKKKEKEYLGRMKEFEEVTNERDVCRQKYENLRRQRLEEFMAGFSVITLKLKEMYQMITLGGDAELELVDSLDPFSEGIVFSVRPPKKSWKNISNLSGGEKTLSSLALVFALHHYKPTPLYVMDEIDAALDFKNVSIVATYIKERTKDAQFIIISLRNNMFELADRLVGIYKTDNATKSLTINPKAFAMRGTETNSPQQVALVDRTNTAPATVA